MVSGRADPGAIAIVHSQGVASQAYRDWLADGSPWKFARPVRAVGDLLAAHGYTVYFEGDQAHLTKDVPEDHTPFSATGWPVPSPYPVCCATDIMPPKLGQVSKLTGRPLPSLQRLAAVLRADRIAGRPEAAFLKYMNHEPDGDNTGAVHDSWQPAYARTASGDGGHIHLSARSDSHLSTASDGYDLVARAEGSAMPVEGVDYSFSRPTPAGLKAAGKQFAVRYGGEGSSTKWLTAAELARLHAAGVDVVANVEGSTGGYKGTAAGRQWATSGEAMFRRLGMGADRPIYFSVDWNAGASDWASIDAALKGSASVIGADRVGVYGSYATVAHCVAAGTASWFWQTYAWSGASLHPKSNLYQYKNGVTIAGGDCDLTRALTADYGQWGVSRSGVDDMPITPDEFVKIRLNSALGMYDMFWSMARGVDIHNIDYEAVGRPTRDNLRVILGDPTTLNATMAVHSQLLAALVAMAQNEAVEVPPTAQAIADAFLADMNGLSAQQAAQALASVLTPAAMVALMAAMQELITHPPARAVDEPADVDIFTQTQRGIAQQHIQESDAGERRD
jgi:hypothetical protein